VVARGTASLLAVLNVLTGVVIGRCRRHRHLRDLFDGLRDTAEFGPQMLAAVVNEMAAAGTEWQTWSVPVMLCDEAERLEAALIAAKRYEREARRRADAARGIAAAHR